MTVRLLEMPVGDALSGAYHAFLARVHLRVSQARGTERVEISLGVFGFCNAVWSFLGIGQYTTGWSVAGLVLTQHEAGLLIAVINLLRWSSVYEGSIRFRRFVTQLAMYFGVAMMALVYLGNPHNPTIPYILASVLVNIAVNGALAKYEERGDSP